MDEKFKQEVKAQIEKLKKEKYNTNKEIYGLNSRLKKIAAEMHSLTMLGRGMKPKAKKKELPPAPSPQSEQK